MTAPGNPAHQVNPLRSTRCRPSRPKGATSKTLTSDSSAGYGQPAGITACGGGRRGRLPIRRGRCRPGRVSATAFRPGCRSRGRWGLSAACRPSAYTSGCRRPSGHASRNGVGASPRRGGIQGGVVYPSAAAVTGSRRSVGQPRHVLTVFQPERGPSGERGPQIGQRLSLGAPESHASVGYGRFGHPSGRVDIGVVGLGTRHRPVGPSLNVGSTRSLLLGHGCQGCASSTSGCDAQPTV